MDLKTSPQYLFIFRNTDLPDHYIIVYGYQSEAQSLFEKTTRTGPKYSIPPADGVPYWHPHYSLEKVLQTDDADEKFADFIKDNIALEKKEGKLGWYGWYILKEIDIEKWKALYQTKISEQRQQLQTAVGKEKKVEQIKMF